MANYYATIRTNYFGVSDESKFRDILELCCAEDTIHLFEYEDSTSKFGFGCNGTIYGLVTGEDDTGFDLDAFYKALQELVAEGDAIIITEVGFEKLRYLIGCCTVITKNDIRFVNVQDKAIELARSMLQDNNFTTQMDY